MDCIKQMRSRNKFIILMHPNGVPLFVCLLNTISDCDPSTSFATIAPCLILMQLLLEDDKMQKQYSI